MVPALAVRLESERRRTGSQLPKPLISLASLYLENGLHSKAERLVDPWLRDSACKFDAADPLSVRLLHNFAALQYRSTQVLQSRDVVPPGAEGC